MFNWNREKKKYIVGLMSGTSCDAVDAILVELSGSADLTDFSIVAFEEFPFSLEIKSQLSRINSEKEFSLSDLCRFDFMIAKVFAEAVQKISEKSGIALSEIDLIGSHGQTVIHLPEVKKMAGYNIKSTFQAGKPSVIAAITGITTVGDFRSADMAVGGEGAPLVPLVDFILFSHKSEGRICLNIGGIANITVLPAGKKIKDIVAFDTGPGNGLLDILSARTTGNREFFDNNGNKALSGKVDSLLLDRLLSHEYFRRNPPKSTGKELFGTNIVDKVLTEKSTSNIDDLFATFGMMTVRSIADAVISVIASKSSFKKMIVSGGGYRNNFIMKELKSALPFLEITSTDRFGIPYNAKEALAFAFLANETMCSSPGNVPSATGASERQILGVVAQGRKEF